MMEIKDETAMENAIVRLRVLLPIFDIHDGEKTIDNYAKLEIIETTIKGVLEDFKFAGLSC